ncbi:hypothetical protein HPB51_013500 [Rhipicephalus microplus]|uniref:Uncharacterized protein n=1 Tax=Rhipicephalus microplus TaxID=6941 RepID=A0A9J6EP54_RHIMP|nr:hypothetical protein HPB51_013500 [Rhipicephalus microplus]
MRNGEIPAQCDGGDGTIRAWSRVVWRSVFRLDRGVCRPGHLIGAEVGNQPLPVRSATHVRTSWAAGQSGKEDEWEIENRLENNEANAKRRGALRAPRDAVARCSLISFLVSQEAAKQRGIQGRVVSVSTESAGGRGGLLLFQYSGMIGPRLPASVAVFRSGRRRQGWMQEMRHRVRKFARLVYTAHAPAWQLGE